MKIEDSPFQFTTTTLGNTEQGNVRRVMGSNTAGFDMLDLAFIELLGTVGSPAKPGVAKEAVEKELERTEQKSSAEKTRDDKPVANKPVDAASGSSDEPRKSVEKELAIFHNQLTPVDIQYMKEIVIPGLPILQGSVPLQSIFPANANSGGFNFHDYEISQKLADLVKAGYKSGRPFRVEMDENSSVILKIRNGKVSAEFISTDRAAALYIKQELDELRQRMATKNLPIDLLSYKEQKEQREQQRNSDDDA